MPTKPDKLNKALDGLQRFRKNSHRYTASRSIAEASEEFRSVVDPIAVWLTENTERNPGASVLKSELVERYNQHTRRVRDGAVVTSASFGISVKTLYPDVREKQRTVDGEPRKWVWMGIHLRGTRLEDGWDLDRE